MSEPKTAPKRKVQAIYKDTFRDVLHRLVETLDDDAVEDGVIAFSLRKKDGGLSIFRQSFGEPLKALGLLQYIRSFIEEEAGEDF